jgi:hypothetical protein
MKTKPIFTLLFFLVIYSAFSGGDPKYPVSAIPDDLKNDVNAVVREDKMIYKILSRSKATLYSLFAVTILNEKGKHFAERVFGYDKLTKIKDLSGSVYDANGKLIKKIKNSEIRDQSSFDGFTLYSDDRLKIVDLSQVTYPYTVEFESVVEYKFLYHIDGSFIVPTEKVSVQHSSYQLIYSLELKPHYKTLNIEKSEPKQERTTDGIEILTWNFENVKPIKFEPLGPLHAELLPQIIAAPSQFEYEGYAGDMSSWENYGKWNLLLNKGRDELPEATRQKVKELTAGLATTEQKAKVLYEYLQSKTRYVGIQLGIGGLQPFEASVVDQTGYGDCKALSNYMVAMLKEAGVKGYYTTVRAGKDEPGMILDFPSHQSNHVIVAIPNGADTLWLECTSQTDPFGYQGTFTGDRKALMITENGGKIVNTLRYTASQNRQLCSADVFLEKNGNGKANVKTIYSGLQYENGGLNFILDDQYDDQKKWLQKNTDIPSFDIGKFSMINIKEKVPSAIVNVDLILNRLATVSGKRIFLTPNLMNRLTFIPEKVENRKTNVVRKKGYSDYDTIRYHVPEEIYPEFLPEPVKFKSRFGEYEASIKLDQGSVVYTRKLILNKGEFPPDSYNELIEFFKSINKADNMKLVFLNKT